MRSAEAASSITLSPFWNAAYAIWSASWGRNHDLRLRTLAALGDLFVRPGDYHRAAAVQKELLHCRSERFGIDHPETLATRAGLGTILFMTTDAVEKT